MYNKATINNNIPSEDSMIACFDFRSEKFNILKVKETFNRAMPLGSILINYNRKLGLLMQDGPYYSCIDRESRSFELWVLEDDVKDEWSKHIYVLPTSWESVVERIKLQFVGIIGTNEIVLAPKYHSVPCYYYIFYYNIEKNTITKVLIQGSETFADL